MGMSLREHNIKYNALYRDLRKETPPFRECTPVMSVDNEKLKKDHIASYNMVAIHNCPGKGACAGWCYARFNRFAMRNVMKPRVINFKSTMRKDYVDIMLEHMEKMVKRGIRRIRWHDSGDFYSQKYVDKVGVIVRDSPHRLEHYAYSKVFHRLDLSGLFEQEKFNLIQSEGGIDDQFIDYNHPLMAVSRVFRNQEELLKAGFVDCSKSDLKAANGHKKIGLIIHGHGTKFFNEDVSTGMEKRKRA